MRVSERRRGRETERQRGMGKKQQYEFFIVIEYGFLEISVGPDETKVIRETQVGHLRAITAERELIVYGVKPIQLLEKYKVHSCFIFYPMPVL